MRPYQVVPRPSQADFTALVEELRELRAAVERQNVLLEEQSRRLAALEAPEVAETVEADPEGAEPRSASGGAQEGARRPWWRRWFVS